MGLCGSTQVNAELDPEPGVLNRNDQVQQELLHARLQDIFHFKLLLLGEGESGKSTLIKHTRLVYEKSKLDPEEALVVRDTLITNLYDVVQSVVRAGIKFNVAFPEKLQALISELADDNLDKSVMDQVKFELISELIQTVEFKALLNRRLEFWLLDNFSYYLEHFPRFYDPKFVPRDDDYLVARAKSTGIIETRFEIENPLAKKDYEKVVKFLIVDVGGQRSERRKWMHVFDKVKCVLYVVNLAGYHMVLYEDQSKNRMHEALELYAHASKDYIKELPVFLILNKKDLFEQALPQYPMKQFFPEYDGPNEVDPCIEFIIHKFQTVHPTQAAPAKIHVVSAHHKVDIISMFKKITSDLIDMNAQRISEEVKEVQSEMS